MEIVGSFSIKSTFVHMNICVIQYVWNIIVCMCAVSIFCLAWLKVCHRNLMDLQYIHWPRALLETLLPPLTAMALPIYTISVSLALVGQLHSMTVIVLLTCIWRSFHWVLLTTKLQWQKLFVSLFHTSWNMHTSSMSSDNIVMLP